MLKSFLVVGMLSSLVLADLPVLKTGQIKSYDQDGNEVTDGSVKDDGFYKKGVQRRYSRDDANEIVTDQVTGLMWQDDADAASITKPWLTQTNYDKCTGQNGQTQDASKCSDTSGDTAATYCANLTLGGYDDWRLPTDKELESIIDYGRANPAVNTTYFQNVGSENYWSSTVFPGYIYDTLFVNFYYGRLVNNSKDKSYYIRCVRSGQN